MTAPRSPFVTALPNLISFGRLLAVPVTIWLILSGWINIAFWVFVVAGLSDAVDGPLARRIGARTVLGGIIDPIADKALLVSAYVTLGYLGRIDDWLVIIVVFRDLLIVAGALLYQAVTKALTMRPLYISKINTAAQIGLAALVLGKGAFGIVDDRGIEQAMIWIVAATTILSGAGYVVVWGWRMLRLEDSP